MIRSRSLIMVHPTGFEPRSTASQYQRSDFNLMGWWFKSKKAQQKQDLLSFVYPRET